MGDHTFPSQPSMVGMATSLIGASSERNPTKEVLNCLRVLQRVLPVIFESELPDLEQQLLWKKEDISPSEMTPSSQASPEQPAPQFVIEDEEDEEPATPVPQTPVHQRSRSQMLGPSLADRLFSAAIDLLFCCGFTLPSKVQVNHHKIQYVIWYALACPSERLELTVAQGEGHWLDGRLWPRSRTRWKSHRSPAPPSHPDVQADLSIAYQCPIPTIVVHRILGTNCTSTPHPDHPLLSSQRRCQLI